MKQILENRFKVLFLFFMYTDNEMMLDEMQSIAETYTKEQVNKISFDALKESVFEGERTDWFLESIQKDETDLRWYMLFALSCENKNDTFTDMLEALQVKLNEKHPNAKKMLTYVEQMAVDVFELKEVLPEFSLN